MFISAVIGIVFFSLAVFPSSMYYEVPVCTIGKFYATSMLVLINSRMVLGSKETQTPSTAISVLRFGAAPENSEDGAIDADSGDVAVDTRAGAGP